MPMPDYLKRLIETETAKQYPARKAGTDYVETKAKGPAKVSKVRAKDVVDASWSVPKKRRNGRSSIFEAELEYIFRNAGDKIPPFVCNAKIIPGRAFEFDFVWEKQKVALELDGAIWSLGRHSRPSGILGDMEKFNLAALLGYRVLRFSTDHHRRGEILPFLIRFFA